MLDPASEHTVSTALPLEDDQTPRPQPWLLHALDVNTLNFCSFAVADGAVDPLEILVAVPNLLDSDSVSRV